VDCFNLKTEDKTETFLNGKTEIYYFPFCLLKKESDLYAAKMTEALREQGVEKGNMTNSLCPFAMASRIDLDKCPWHNRPSFK
jgi:peptidase E